MHLLTLRDGRKLAYTWFGQAREGGSGTCRAAPGAATARRTLVYLHGFPSSRLEAGLIHKDALHYNLNVLAVDRPGAGASSYNPEQTVESTALDVRELLDHLEIQNVVVMGGSGGSPFACACAALMPDRVEALLLVCPLMPACGREDELLKGTSTNTLRLVHGICNHPWRVWVTLNLLRLMQRLPHGDLLLKFGGFAGVDKQAMQEYPQEAAVIKAAVREGMMQGVAGAVRDLQIFYVDPPTLQLSTITCKTVVWQGDLDMTTPLGMAKHYASSIAGAQLHVVRGEAHLSLPFRHNRKILGSIVESFRQ